VLTAAALELRAPIVMAMEAGACRRRHPRWTVRADVRHLADRRRVRLERDRPLAREDRRRTGLDRHAAASDESEQRALWSGGRSRAVASRRHVR